MIYNLLTLCTIVSLVVCCCLQSLSADPLEILAIDHQLSIHCQGCLW